VPESGRALRECAARQEAYALLTSALRALGRSDRALAACDEGLRHDPDHPGLLFNLALAHRLGGNLAQAEAMLRRPLSVSQQGDQPASVDTGISSYKARYALAAIPQERGRAQEAEEVLRELPASAPVSSTASAPPNPTPTSGPAPPGT
jgi:tetratricopeptide (TPR) repeat protein